ncbi:MAG: translation initiation factor IF-3 [Patescibacteria group bacterium]
MRSKYIPWKVGEEIKAESLRVIDSEAKQIGILTREEALLKAKEAGLDLIEVVPQANPPVAKIINLGKFLYQEEKRKKIEAKKVKGGEVKEVRLSPFIAENDYNTRLKRLREFLEGKNKAKVVVVFKGRQMNSKPFGYSLLNKVLDNLGREGINVDMEPKFMGRHLIMIISPTNKFKKEK